MTTARGSVLFGSGSVPTGPSDIYKDLSNEGSALIMNIEINQSLENSSPAEKAPDSKTKAAVVKKTKSKQGGSSSVSGGGAGKKSK